MSQVPKPAYRLNYWAQGAAAGAGGIVDPGNSAVDAGWGISATPPALEYFNWVLQYTMQGVRYTLTQGTPNYDAGETYAQNAVVQGPDGLQYQSLINANSGNTPSATFGTAWGPVQAVNPNVTDDSNSVATTEFVRNAIAAYAPGTSVRALYKNLRISTIGTTAQISTTCDEVVLENAAGQFYKAAAVALNCNLSGAGAGGLDTGAVSGSTWYYIYYIYAPGTGTLNIIGSLAAPSVGPLLPSGYTFYACIGRELTQAAGPYYPLAKLKINERVRWLVGSAGNMTALPVMHTGSTGLVMTAIGVSPYAPPNAAMITLSLYSSYEAAVAPNVNYPLNSGCPMFIANAGSNSGNVLGDIMLEGPNIYLGCQAGTTLYSVGYVDIY